VAAAVHVSRLTEPAARARADQLTALLIDAVDHGASVGFLRPLEADVARAYWDEAFGAVAKGSRILLIAELDGELVGTVQLDLAMRPNGRHRAEVQKLLVLARCRRQGIARQLMHAIEREATAETRWLLVLDTESSSGAEPFYEALQWIRCGSIPGFALSADGVPTPNVIYHKIVGSGSSTSGGRPPVETHQLSNTIALLARTPAALDALLRDLPDAWTQTREGDGTWNAVDIVGHLSHAERTDWMPRVRMILDAGETRTFEPFDRRGQEREGGAQSLGLLLDEFARLRANNLADLRALNLGPDDLARRGRHPALGVVTLSALLATWAAHDLTHLHQLSRVMAHQYREAVGPWSRYLGVLQCAGHSSAS
jgi:GNAT superfamily N-acetyltransferase